jgi:hypothetical protein
MLPKYVRRIGTDRGEPLCRCGDQARCEVNEAAATWPSVEGDGLMRAAAKATDFEIAVAAPRG